MAAAPPTDASNAELARWAVERLSDRDVSILRQFWTADTVERFPDRTCRGEGEVAAYFDELFAAVPDLQMEVRDVVGQDEHVYVHWHLTGTHSGAPFAGIEPTGRALAIDGIDQGGLQREGEAGGADPRRAALSFSGFTTDPCQYGGKSAYQSPSTRNAFQKARLGCSSSSASSIGGV